VNYKHLFTYTPLHQGPSKLYVQG